MAALRRLFRARRHALMAIFACAILVRALVPSGWMVAPTAHGGAPRLVLCDGMAADPAPHAMAGMHHGRHDPPQPAPEHPCAFAGVGLAFDLPTLATPPVPAMAQAWLPPSRTLTLAPGRGLAAPPPPATGPPAFA